MKRRANLGSIGESNEEQERSSQGFIVRKFVPLALPG